MSDHNKIIRRASYLSVATALVLITIKTLAWIETGSVAMLSTLIDSLLDAGLSLINLFAIRHALAPADKEHRFGHGKAEALAGMAQGVFIISSALILAWQAIPRFWEPRTIQHAETGVAVMIVSMLFTGLLVWHQHRVSEKTGSVAIKGDATHYRADLLANAGVILSLILTSTTGLLWVDPLVALLIAANILHDVKDVVVISINQLMDRELPDKDRNKIRLLAMNHPSVRGVHDLRTRLSGRDCFIQLHLELYGGMTLENAHQVAEEVESAIIQAYPKSEVLIHQDPID